MIFKIQSHFKELMAHKLKAKLNVTLAVEWDIKLLTPN